MSNKIQLQTNNITLDSYITRINTAKDIAASLPEAGGGAQVAPVISVDSNGIITATAGSKTSTHLLPFQPAKTITPTIVSQVAISSGYYAGGDITVQGDSRLVAENIKKGVVIFGVNGTFVGDGGVNPNSEDGVIARTISVYENSRVSSIGNYAFAFYSSLTSANFPSCTNIGSHAFYSCYQLTSANFPICTNIGNSAFYSCRQLTSANFPSCTNIGSYAFAYCSSLTSANFPVCTNIGSSAFAYCSSLTSANFPSCTNIGSSAFYSCRQLTSVSFPICTNIDNYAFAYCSSLTSASFPSCTNIYQYAFSRCYMLTSVYLTASSVCQLSNSNAFTSTPIGGYSTKAGTYGSIYVPASLVNSYKTATNWTYFSKRIVGV